MNFNQNTNQLSNERIWLINILNTMYNDNLRQVNSLTDTLNNLNESNSQIRSLLVQLLTPNNINNSRNNNTRNRYFSYRTTRENRDQENYTVPYSIDTVLSVDTMRDRDTRNNTMTDLLNDFLQPITIYPSQTQIEASTRHVRYCDILTPINTSCPISMEDFNDNDQVCVIRHCGHIFNTEHLMNWFRSNCRCPVCRYDIRDYRSNVSREIFNETNGSSRNILERNVGNVNTNYYDTSANTINSVTTNGNRRSNFNNIDTIMDELVSGLNIRDLSGNLLNNDTSSIVLFLLNSLGNRRI